MSDLPSRRYNEHEVSRLLKRASELQRSSPAAPNPAGLTLSELEDIAREAGLDPEMLRRAANELETTSSTPHLLANFVGAPLRLVLERTVPGECDEVLFANLVPQFERAFDGPGQVGQVSKTFSWVSTRPNSGRTQQLRVSSKDGQTNIRIEESFGGLVGGLFGGVLGGVGGGVGIGVGGAIGGALGSVALGFGFPILIISSTYYALRRGYSHYIARRQQTLDRLLSDVAEAVSTHTPRLPAR